MFSQQSFSPQHTLKWSQRNNWVCVAWFLWVGNWRGPKGSIESDHPQVKGPEMLSSPISHPLTNGHTCEAVRASV